MKRRPFLIPMRVEVRVALEQRLRRQLAHLTQVTWFHLIDFVLPLHGCDVRRDVSSVHSRGQLRPFRTKTHAFDCVVRR